MTDKFSRWSTLFSQNLSRDWKKILIWLVGVTTFSGGFVPAFEELTSGQGLAGLYETLQNPAMIAMVGPTPASNAAEYTLGAIYANEMLLFCSLFAAVISVLHVVSQTRKKEELGLIELIRSFRVGRQANSLAVIAESILINLLLAISISCTMIFFQADSITAEGSWLFGLSVGSMGILGSAVALFAAQLMPSSASSNGLSLAFLGGLYLLRAITDVADSSLSMWNPLGWSYLTYPFTTNNWIPLLYLFLFSLILIISSFVLEEHRDLNTGYIPEREGKPYAKRSLLSLRGLLFYLNKGMTISWLITFGLMGAAYGSIYGNMQQFLESNDLMKQMFIQSGVSIEKNFTSTIMVVLICLAAILPIASINRLFTEETHGRMNQLFATKISRNQLYWTNMLLAILFAILAILISSGALGLSALASMKDAKDMDLLMFLKAGFNFLPAVLVFIGISGFLFGWLPRMGKLAYIYLAYSFALNYFGGILDLPEWFSKTAVPSWVPRMPNDSFDLSVFLMLSCISLALFVLGSIGYRRRDLLEG
ncbi:tetronasin resistance protein [Enterococcus faecium]|uniref:ABC transporter permease n=1 Tax=Enterococcus faecium TaxID=1352 RepID=UPI001883121A|nr:tetronasin resistance protein [Enterococcus faecium]MBE9890125.1 tetronasin resistance protein [Enterococcus faecium]MEB7476717.1 tetronasin resistance protein [Enterococcus faecium]MEB8313610.1 tetronasin resistance protein [Enterococcus faecium]MEB8448929.1 tetronasin resistance protein [Enterococcus faecium]